MNDFLAFKVLCPLVDFIWKQIEIALVLHNEVKYFESLKCVNFMSLTPLEMFKLRHINKLVT